MSLWGQALQVVTEVNHAPLIIIITSSLMFLAMHLFTGKEM